MNQINTIRGPKKLDSLGIIDYHEHLFVKAANWFLEREPDYKLNDIKKSADELKSWASAGGKTVLECTTIDFGRDIKSLIEIANLVPNVNIIVPTGFNKPLYCDRWVRKKKIEELVKFCVHEVNEGIENTEVKAGFVKAGSSYMNIDKLSEKLLRVAARTHLETGVPIITHTQTGTMALEQLDIFEEEKIELHRICLSHLDRNPDVWYHLQILKRGAYIGYDCPGKIKYGTDSIRIQVLKEIIERGYHKQILLGNDMSRISYFKSYGGGPGLDYVLTKYIPRLKMEGISEKVINDILIKNPKRFLSGEK